MKIENIVSRILEIALLVVAIGVTVMFFVGGYYEGTKEPVYTDLLLNTTFALVAVSLIVTFVLSLINYIRNLLHEPKKSLKSLLAPLAIIAIIYVSYLMGDDTPLNLPGYEGTGNEGMTLVLADVCLFTAYIMVAITVVATLATSLVKAIR